MKVGVFDSGIGGFSVVKSLLEHKLFEEIIYFGDTARVPYGTKDAKTIIRYSLEALDFFKLHEIDMLIAACNTVSAYAFEELRKSTNVPVVGVIEPGILALESTINNKDSSILILGTKSTIKSNQYQNLLTERGYTNLTSLAPSLFVPLVEEGITQGPILEEAIKFYFKDIKKEPDAIILGCTHFPMLSKPIKNYFPNAKLIHSGEAMVNYLSKKYLLPNNDKNTLLKLFASDNQENIEKSASLWLNNLHKQY